MRVRRAGPRALLVELADPPQTRAWYAELLRRRDLGELGGASGGSAAVDVVPGARTVLVEGLADVGELERRLSTWPEPATTESPAGPVVEVDVVYDGPDLAAVAARWGGSEADAVSLHTSVEYTAAFCGFSPGFAYLTGLPPHLQVPRLATPRTRVPAGSVGLAGPYCGIYPRESPGGWQLVGRTALRMWDLRRDPPARLAPGTRVRFVAVT